MQIYLVGGAVRDELLHREVIERDYVVVGATPKQMLDQGFTQVGKDFPVFLHPKTKEEYALARTERKTGVGYTGFTCDASAEVSLEEDLQRRDLTVNAMAKDEQGNIIDPYNGLADLESKTLRHVSAAFSEDPLRVFRVARFAARYAHLGFRVASETQALMQKMSDSGELTNLSAQRIWQETQRSLMEQNPEVYFQVLDHAHALPAWFGELQNYDLDAYRPLQLAATQGAPATVRFACLTAKLLTQEVKALCQRLTAPNAFSELATLSASLVQPLIEKRSAETLLECFNRADAWRKGERFEELVSTAGYHALATGTPLTTWKQQQQLIHQALAAARQVDVQAIIAQGHKGKAIKEALESERQRAIAQNIQNQAGAHP